MHGRFVVGNEIVHHGIIAEKKVFNPDFANSLLFAKVLDRSSQLLILTRAL